MIVQQYYCLFLTTSKTMALLKASIKLVTPEKNTDIETFEELSLKQGF